MSVTPADAGLTPVRETTGYVADTIAFSNVDGPGNRFVVFLQGCNFDCVACHNPQTIPGHAPVDGHHPQRRTVGDLLDHISTCAPHHRLFAAGISDIFHVDETALRNPDAVVDIIRGAFRSGMRDFTFNYDGNEFVRITGYLVRKSDLAAVECGAPVRHTSDRLAAGSERNFHLTSRAVKRIGCHERDPR